MGKSTDIFKTYFRKKYPRDNYTPTEILSFRNDLEKKYGRKIIPEFKEKELSEEEVLARIEYAALSDALRKSIPEIDKLDKRIISLLKAEQKTTGRLFTLIFLILKLISVGWAVIWLFMLIGDFSFDSLWLFLLLGTTPLFLVVLFEVFYWYVAGIIEFDEIFPAFKDYIRGIFNTK